MGRTLAPCSTSQHPITPKPSYRKGRKSSSSKADHDQLIDKRKSVSNRAELTRTSSDKSPELITPPGSSRYLLGDTSSFQVVSDFEPVLELVPVKQVKSHELVNTTESEVTASKAPSSSSSSSTRSRDQVVVLRVSLHCKGCERKLRKYLSRMEGVTSYDIDFAAKKVTVIGEVTPLSVLANVSKVKYAQFWASTSTVTSSIGSKYVDFKK